MKHWVLVDEELIPIEKYWNYLGESFSLKQVKYGTNLTEPVFSNNEIADFPTLEKLIKEENHRLTYSRWFYDYYCTFFEYEGMYYIVNIFIDNDKDTKYYEFVFGTSKIPTRFPKKYQTNALLGEYNTLQIINRVFYCFFEICKKFSDNIKGLKFSLSELGRENLYRAATKNKSFLDAMNNIGFVFSHEGNEPSELFNKEVPYWYFDRI